MEAADVVTRAERRLRLVAQGVPDGVADCIGAGLARPDAIALHLAGGETLRVPFGVNEGVPVWLDESLKRFETVYPAAGNAASAVELTLPELEEAGGALGWVDISKIPQE